jgi:glycosyltransferase involved in cell wall biosynthesis
VLRLLIDAGNAPPYTGTGVYGSGLMTALKQYSSSEIDVAEAGTSLVGNSVRPLRRLVYLWRLSQLAKRGYNGVDIVHFINVYVPRKRTKIAIVGTIHDLDAIQHPDVYTRRYSAYYRKTVGATLQRADMILTDTEAVRGVIMDRYRVAEDRISAVGIGLHSLFVDAVDGIPKPTIQGDPVVLFVGRLEKKKNIAWCVRTVAEGVRRGALPVLRLALAGGRGHGFEEIAAALRDAKDIAQWFPHPDIGSLAKLYQQAEVVVLPSFCEGFGIPLLEAMYCGKPIVASRIPTNLEVAGEAARYFELGNKDELYSALCDALTRGNSDARVNAAREKLRAYSWERLAPCYVSVYRKVRP